MNQYRAIDIWTVLSIICCLAGLLGYLIADTNNRYDRCIKNGFTYSEELNRCTKVVETLR